MVQPVESAENQMRSLYKDEADDSAQAKLLCLRGGAIIPICTL